MAENCAESPTTVTPHSKATARSSKGDPPNKKPIPREQAADVPSIREVAVVRPQRSASAPPAQEPKAPAAMKAKVAKAAVLPTGRPVGSPAAFATFAFIAA